MRTLFFVFALSSLPSSISLFTGCSSSGATSNTADGGDAGEDTTPAPDPCAGLGCASMPGPLVIKVVDPSGAPIASPTFREGTTRFAASCPDDVDAGSNVCPSGWRLSVPEGTQTIVVEAPGFASKELTVKIQGPPSCCGIGPEVDETATLAPATTDAGAD